MKTGRYSKSRQKACRPCSNAKARCDRKAGSCGRCALRGLICIYAPTSPRSTDARDETGRRSDASEPVTLPVSRTYTSQDDSSPARTHTSESIERTPQSGAGYISDNASSVNIAGYRYIPNRTLLKKNEVSRKIDSLDFSCMDLICPINAESIQNRWLNSFISTPGQLAKTMPPSTTAFIYRVLKSYAAIAVNGHTVPPFVHCTQVAETNLVTPLSTCLSLIRICQQPLPGSQQVAANVLQREMADLYENHGMLDNFTILAAFQAYLIYTLVSYFRLGRDAVPSLRQVVINLQEIACSCAKHGLSCTTEGEGTRPTWESWIVAEAKRRTLYTMYLFDNMLSVQDGLPTFLGTELRGLLAPTSKYLWEATTRSNWEKLYNLHLVEWVDGGLRIDELWPPHEELTEDETIQRDRRVDQWLEGVDEFGTMMYAVTSCTHGN